MQDKARKAIDKQKILFSNSKERVTELKGMLRKALHEELMQKKWIDNTNNMVTQLEKQKKSIKLKYDLKRLTPVLKEAKAHQDQLLREQNKWKSTNKEMSSKVTEIMDQLKALKDDSDNLKEEMKEDTGAKDKGKKNKSESKKKNGTKDENDNKKKLDLDALLNVLDSSNGDGNVTQKG